MTIPVCPEGFLGFHVWAEWGPKDELRMGPFSLAQEYQERTCKLCGVIQRRFI